MKKQVFIILILITNYTLVNSNPKIFSKQEILGLSNNYLNSNLNIMNPAMIDIDGDGDFDILEFASGKVKYYENTRSLDNPEFILKNDFFGKYTELPALHSGLPMSVFFADGDGNGLIDVFALKDIGYNELTKQNEFRVLYYKNNFAIDTGTLITIILILVIILLVLAILR